VSPISNALRLGLLYFFPSLGVASPTFPASTGRIQSTILPPDYFKQDGTLATFGTANLDSPVLHLQFLLKKDLLAPAPKRFPYINKGSASNLGPGFTDEYPIAFLPAFGRKHIVIEAHGSVAGMTFRVGALRGINQFVTFRSRETTEGTALAGGVDSTVRFQLDFPCADYIIIYATSPVAVASTADFTFMAVD